jgi:hypothetical protein
MLCYSDVFHSTIIVYGARDADEMLLNITEWMLPACTAHASKSQAAEPIHGALRCSSSLKFLITSNR